jgi:signal transduction histidine kinase
MLPSNESHKNAPPLSLAQAFASFSQAAGSLEKSYAALQQQVAALRTELDAACRNLQQERKAVRHWQALARVSRVLAHEIRNPLASMELWAGLLVSSKELNDADHESARNLQAGIRLLTATINNILHFHAAPLGQRTALHVGELLRQTVEFLRPAALQARVEIGCSDGLEDTRVNGDPSRLQQVLLNLALNAIRAMPHGGRLTFSAEMDEQVKISVFDTGPGIPVDLRHRIFEPGFTTRSGSLGLGLAVAKTIMQQHRGDIRLLATDEGAGFELTLPRAET